MYLTDNPLLDKTFLHYFTFCNRDHGSDDTRGSLSCRIGTFLSHPATATGSELFSYLTCLHTTRFILSIFSLAETISLKIWERLLSWHAKCSFPVAVRSSKCRLLSSLMSYETLIYRGWYLYGNLDDFHPVETLSEC